MATDNVDGEIFAVSSHFKWIIDIFCMGCKNVGDRLKSPIFSTTSANRNIQWYMCLYPKGRSEKTKDYFGLSICALADITAQVTIEVINNIGQVAFIKMICESQKLAKNKRRGVPDFVSRKFIYDPANNILNDDKLTIVCKITISDNNHTNEDEELTSEEEQKLEAEIVSQRLAEIDKYEVLINNDKFSDISLISEGQEIKAHKCILTKSSPIFASMFDIDMKEKQCSTVEIADMKYDVLVEMIRFVYAGKVNDIDTFAGELAEAAEKYALDELKNICEITMCKNLSIDNVLLCVDLADRCRMDELKEKGIQYIVAHADDVTNQEEFKLLPSILMSEICRALVEKMLVQLSDSESID